MDCEANSDVSTHSAPSSFFCRPSVAHSHLSVQELLCYLIDDGGFLIMSNQKDDWNKVRTRRLSRRWFVPSAYRVSTSRRWECSSATWSPT